jgi:hypothetical protein
MGATKKIPKTTEKFQCFKKALPSPRFALLFNLYLRNVSNFKNSKTKIVRI